MKKFSILLSSDCNYEKLVAEIYYDEKYVGLINQDNPDNLLFELPIDFHEGASHFCQNKTTEYFLKLVIEISATMLENLRNITFGPLCS